MNCLFKSVILSLTLAHLGQCGEYKGCTFSLSSIAHLIEGGTATSSHPSVGQSYTLENSTHKIVYYYEPRFTRYDENERICSVKGMSLAYVRSPEENDFIKNFRTDHVRLGALKDPFSRKYEWADGSEITYNNWSRDNYFYQGCCSVEMDELGKWRKYRGDSSHLLCQKVIDKHDPKYNETIEEEVKNPTEEEEKLESSTQNSSWSENVSENNKHVSTPVQKDKQVSEREVANAIEYVQRSLLDTIQEILVDTKNNLTRINREIDQKIDEKLNNSKSLQHQIEENVKEDMNSTFVLLFNQFKKNLSADLDQKMNLYRNESAYSWSEMTSKNAITVSRGIESKVNAKLDSAIKEIQDKNDRLTVSFQNEISDVKTIVRNLTRKLDQLKTTPCPSTPTPVQTNDIIPTISSTNVKSTSNNLSMVNSEVVSRNIVSEKLSEDSHFFLSDQVKASQSVTIKSSGSKSPIGIYLMLIALIMIGTVLIVYKKFLRDRMFKRLNESEDGMMILE